MDTATLPPGTAAVPAPDEEDVRRIGESLHHALPGRLRAPARLLDDAIMRATTGDERLRAALFRFVDVRPACRDRRDVAHHLLALLQESQPAGWPGRLTDTLAARPRTHPLIAVAAGAGVQRMAQRFIAGPSVAGALPRLRAMWGAGLGASVDLLGEATVTEIEADRYARRCAEGLEALTDRSRCWPAHPALEADVLGPVPRANLSVKITALTPQIRPEAPRRGIDAAVARLRPLLRRARDLGAHLHIDMESLDSRETVLGLALELLAEPEFRDGPSAGVVLQAYLRDSPQELEQILGWAAASARSVPLTVRLVKGAYWDHEVVEARRHGWEVPVFESRAECDRNYEALTRRLLGAHPLVRTALASHNLRSLAHGLACLPAAGLGRTDVELQVLRGLGDDLAAAMAAMGLRVRVYCPVGDLIEGMAYLVRRMLENTANDSFLAAQAQGMPLARLLAAP